MSHVHLLKDFLLKFYYNYAQLKVIFFINVSKSELTNELMKKSASSNSTLSSWRKLVLFTIN